MNFLEFLSSLCSQSKDDVVKQLLVHLPLLQPGNHLARQEYLNILPKVLSHSHEHSIHEEECRQLLSLALVHPAFPPNERNKLQQWLQILDEKLVDSSLGNCVQGGYYDPKMNDFPPSDNMNRRVNTWRHAQLEKKDSGLGNSFDHHAVPPYTSLSLPPNLSIPHQKVSKSQSLSSAVMNLHRERPPVSNGGDDFSSEGCGIVNRPGRSLSYPVDPQKLHKPLSPQSSLESETDEANNVMKMSNYPENPNPGMKGKWCAMTLVL